MWGNCACQHHQASHYWDDRKLRYTFCETCTVCGGKERDHSPFGHEFQRCVCMEYQEAA